MLKIIIKYIVDNLIYLLQYVALKIYFRSIQIIGEENLNKNEPSILVANHNCHFTDGWLLTISIRRKLNIIMAKSTKKHIFLKYFIPFLNVILIDRPIDNKIIGKGKLIEIHENKIIGNNDCDFLNEFNLNQSILLGKRRGIFKIQKIIDNKTLLINKDLKNEIINENYFIIPKLDYSKIYKDAIKSVNKGEMILIFPEGGSFEELQIVEMKPGVFFLANEYYNVYKKMPKIQVVGLNYFGSYKFRSKCLVNIGKEMILEEKINKELNDSNKRKECINQLLFKLKTKIENLKILSPSMSNLMDYQLVKNLLLSNKTNISEKYKFYLLKKLNNIDNLLSKDNDLKNFLKKIRKFRKDLKQLGFTYDEFKNFKPTLYYTFNLFIFSFFKIILIIPPFIPILLLFFIFSKITKKFVNKMRKREIKNSNRKKLAYDVISSWVILTSIFLLTFLFYLFIFLSYIIFKSNTKFNNYEIIKYQIMIIFFVIILSLLYLSINYSIVKDLRNLKMVFNYFTNYDKIIILYENRNFLIKELSFFTKKYQSEFNIRTKIN